MSEYLYYHNHCQRQPDIDALQEILDNRLFNTLYNLQEAFEKLKIEFEKGNYLIDNCLFDFDIEGHLKFVNDKTTNPSKIDFIFSTREMNIFLDNENDNAINLIRKVVLNRRTPNESLGFSIFVCKHRLLNINGIFIQDIQPNGLADL